MARKQGWLGHQLREAKREVEGWDDWKREAMRQYVQASGASMRSSSSQVSEGSSANRGSGKKRRA